MTTMWLMRSIAEALGPTDAQAAATRASTVTSRRKCLIPLSLRDPEAERTSFRDRSALLTASDTPEVKPSGAPRRGRFVVFALPVAWPVVGPWFGLRKAISEGVARSQSVLIQGAGIDGTGKRGVSGQSDSHGQTDAAAPQCHPKIPRWSGPRTGIPSDQPRPVALHDDPPQHAALAPVVVAVGPVHRRAIVDHQHVALAPGVVVDDLRPDHAVEQVAHVGAARLGGHAAHVGGLGDVEVDRL